MKNKILIPFMLILGACNGMTENQTTCPDQYKAEVEFDSAVLKLPNLCEGADKISTCLTPDDSCEACLPIRCCAEIQAWSKTPLPTTPELDECRKTQCPICK